MNNIPCGVIRDLLPLYTEELCSVESRRLVESHLKKCPDCRSLKESMKKTEPLTVDSGESLKKMKRELRNRRGRVAAMAALLVFVAVWLLQRLQLVITQDMVSQSAILRFFVDHSPMDWITSL